MAEVTAIEDMEVTEAATDKIEVMAVDKEETLMAEIGEGTPMVVVNRVTPMAVVRAVTLTVETEEVVIKEEEELEKRINASYLSVIWISKLMNISLESSFKEKDSNQMMFTWLRIRIEQVKASDT